MPYTLEPWEVAYEERRINEEKFKRELTDRALLEEVACGACRLLEKKRLISKASPLIQKWWKLHNKEDAKRGK